MLYILSTFYNFSTCISFQSQISDNLHILPGQRHDILLAIHDFKNGRTIIDMAGAVPSIPPGHPVTRRTSQNSLGSNSTGSHSDGSGTVSTPQSRSLCVPPPLFDQSPGNRSNVSLTLASFPISPASAEGHCVSIYSFMFAISEFD